MKENITSRIIIFSVCLSQSIYVLVLFIFDCYRSKKTFMIHSFNWCFCFCFCFEERFFFSKRQQFVCLCRLVCQWNHCRLCSEWMECVIVEFNSNKQKSVSSFIIIRYDDVHQVFSQIWLNSIVENRNLEKKRVHWLYQWELFCSK